MLMKIVMIESKKCPRHQNVVFYEGVFGRVLMFVLVVAFLLLIMVVMIIVIVIIVMVVGGGVTEVGRDRKKSLIEVFSPRQLDSLAHQAFFSEKLGGCEIRINQRPRMEVLIILKTDSGEHTAATEFKASRKILKLQEGFLKFPIDIVIGIRKNVDVGEAGKPVIDPKVKAWLKSLNREVVVWIVGVAANLAE
jgi:hypothetical protein